MQLFVPSFIIPIYIQYRLMREYLNIKIVFAFSQRVLVFCGSLGVSRGPNFRIAFSHSFVHQSKITNWEEMLIMQLRACRFSI